MKQHSPAANPADVLAIEPNHTLNQDLEFVDPKPASANSLPTGPNDETVLRDQSSVEKRVSFYEIPIVDEESLDHRDHIPDGGLRAWLVVLGSFVAFLMGFGLLNSFGTFQACYQMKWPDMSTSSITWIGSSQIFCLFLGGVIIGPIYDNYGAKPLMWLGTIFCLGSMILMSWSTVYWHYLVSQGFLFGIGNALLFYPATSAITEWFSTKRGLALGIAVSGSSIGGIIWPFVIVKLLDEVSEEMAFRIMAGASAPLLLLSCVLVRERKDPHDARPMKTGTGPGRGLFRAILDVRFLALCICLTVLYSGLLIPFYYIPSYPSEAGVHSSLADKLLPLVYSGSFFSRIVAGWLGDHLGRFNIVILMGTLMGGMTYAWIWMTSNAGMIAYAILFGLFSGGLVPLGSACVAQTTEDMERIGLRIGVMMAISSLGALGGGPVSGHLKDFAGGWPAVLTFSGLLAIAGAVLLMFVRFWYKPRVFARF
ncbi:hypothetical protein HIM_02148 [Hirsutella minnesotensis 3608]|nr:hypothetical protein HIM_02148 [Hirsutella minnesotensis 3608]